MERAPEPNSLPLWGVPFAVKDNIDVSGLPTTAACPAFAYQPEKDATVVARLKAAGALVIGKTNLDQFATGLNGTRSPYGAPRSVFDKAYVSGGSSSGSAVTVAAGLASFALGTDTAGSGRVPAAFNNLVGIKPTPGLVPNVGVVPACRSVDVVTVFAATVGDGVAIRKVMDGYDAGDPYSRKASPVALPGSGLRIGVLEGAEREFFGNKAVEALYDQAIERAKSLGATIVPFDYAPFRQAAELLYNGPWVAERLAAVKEFIGTNADDFDPTVRTIIEGARGYDAVAAFEGQYKLGHLRQKALVEWEKLDVLMLPTSPTTYTVEAMLADPIVKNSHFGRYTNFANLFGYAAIAVPGGFGSDGLPSGVTFFGPSFSDDALAPFADAMHRAAQSGMGKDKTASPAGSLEGCRTGRWPCHHHGRRRASDRHAAEPRTDRPRRQAGEDLPHGRRLSPLRPAEYHAAQAGPDPRAGLRRQGTGGGGLEGHARCLRPLRPEHPRTARHRQGHARRWKSGVRLPLRALCHQGRAGSHRSRRLARLYRVKEVRVYWRLPERRRQYDTSPYGTCAPRVAV